VQCQAKSLLLSVSIAEPHPIFEDSKIDKGECIANRYANKKGLTIF